MPLLRAEKYDDVAKLYDKPYKKVEYITEGTPNLKILEQARAIANNTDDVKAIAKKMNIPEPIVKEVKQHFFIREHFMEVNGTFYKGRFERYPEDIAIWKAAEKDGLANGYLYKDEGMTFNISTEEAKAKFNRLIAHEYVESKLMQQGFPYRSYIDGNTVTPYSFGAHDLTISTNEIRTEYIMLEKYIQPSIMPSAFDNNFLKLDQIVKELSNIFK